MLFFYLPKNHSNKRTKKFNFLIKKKKQDTTLKIPKKFSITKKKFREFFQGQKNEFNPVLPKKKKNCKKMK